MRKWICVVLALLFCCNLASACAEALDYSQPEMWAYYQTAPDKAADLFFVCPTVDMGKDGNFNMSMADENTLESFVGATNMELGIYDELLSVYVPYYRQATFPAYSLAAEESESYFALAYEDVREAFVYYLKHSDGRPFVLAGFSQGADMALRLMKEFFGDTAVSDRLIAAYCIGWRLTKEEVAQYPYLVPAQGEKDTGVIVLFNTEAENITDSLLVPEGITTLSINPLNWKTDSTLAGKEENMGACFTNYAGEIKKEMDALTGAYISETRGTLIATDIVPADYANSLFPDGVYHLYDYQFFYRNLQENVKTRVNAYFGQE